MTQTASKSTTGGVQSVERAFELLEVIARAGGEAALSELAADTPLPLPTIHRLLRTLVGAEEIAEVVARATGSQRVRAHRRGPSRGSGR